MFTGVSSQSSSATSCNTVDHGIACDDFEKLVSSEMVQCEMDAFIGHYGPCPVDDDALQSCLDTLSGLTSPPISQCADGSYALVDFLTALDDVQMKGSGTLNVMTLNLLSIVDAIYDFARDNGRETQSLRFQTCPLGSRPKIPGTGLTLDAYIADIEQPAARNIAQENVFPLGSVVSPVGVTRSKASENVAKVRQRIFTACRSILNEDPRRVCVYACTFEADIMVIWYFSRSHCAKSFAFNWLEDPRLLVKMWLSLAIASPQQLGLDPLIYKVPGDDTYVYQVANEAQSREGHPPVYYQTVQLLKHNHPKGIIGRVTRVWKVRQVHSFDDLSPVSEDKYVVLKDVWRDVDTASEADNQDRLFQAIEDFAAGDWRNDKRLKHFDAVMLRRLEYLLTNQTYKTLFLTGLYTSKGQRSKALAPDIYSWRGASDGDDELTNIQSDRMSGRSVPSSVTDTSTRRFIEKQQFRFVYREVCTPLHNLQTLGEVMDGLRQAVDALLILFCAGWVHRDVSSGNILAFRQDTTFQWSIKLSDLEFARPHIVEGELLRKESRVGTALFMPAEIMANIHLLDNIRLVEGNQTPVSGPPPRFNRACFTSASAAFVETLADQLHATGESREVLKQFEKVPAITAIPPDAKWSNVPQADGPVTYNYQHDLESIWWIALWFLTSCVDHDESKRQFARVFRNSFATATERLCTLRNPLSTKLRTEVKGDPVWAMNFMRCVLYDEYIERAVFGKFDSPDSYSRIHDVFNAAFEGICAKPSSLVWRDLRVDRFPDSVAVHEPPRQRRLPSSFPSGEPLADVTQPQECDTLRPSDSDAMPPVAKKRKFQ